jgi:hypothetical protein
MSQKLLITQFLMWVTPEAADAERLNKDA